VTLRGLGFADSDGPVDFVVYNKTSSGGVDFWWTMEVVDLPGGKALDDPCVTNSTGEFYGYWLVPDKDILSKGNYYINVTDVEDYAVTMPFAVGDVHILATPRKDTFRVGDTISFNLEHSFGNVEPTKNSILKIYNPTGALVYSGDKLATWTKTGLWYTAPYSSQNAGGNPMVLTEDAPLGTWSWKWIDSSTDAETIKTGTFAVIASAESTLATQVTGLTTAVGELKTTVAGVKTDVAGIASSAAAAKTSADAATAAATAAGTAATAAGTKADTAAAAANSAAAAAKSAADSASGLTTLVYAAIGASLIAALAAIVALMQISRKIA
jgi:hypothetical protein